MNEPKYLPFPVLLTKDYCLRQLSVVDKEEIFILRSDERVLKYLDIQKAEMIEDATNFIEKILNKNINNEWIYWGISRKGDSKLIGTVCLWNFSEDRSKADIGFALLPEYHGKGIMQEVISVVIHYGFTEINLNCIIGEAAADNIKSIKLMEKFGFKYENKINEFVVYSLEK